MLKTLTLSPDPCTPQDHEAACRGCRQAQLTMQCAACGRRTAIISLASSVCHIEWCERCWQTLLAVRVGTRALQAWPLDEYVAIQSRREQAHRPTAAIPKPRRPHRRTTPQDVSPQALPWGKDDNELAQGGAA
jgi:hypothetical protein